MIEKHTALYSDLDIEYSQAMSGPYENLCHKSEDAVLIAGFKEGKITGFWRPMVAFGDERKLKMLIEDLWGISQDIYYQDFLIDGKLSVISQFLLRHGYKATPYYTQVIDLTKSEEDLHADLRKSYKSLCNKKTSTADGFSVLRKLHREQRGKTRDEKTWDIQEKAWQIHSALLVTCKYREAAGLFYYNKHFSYYFSGASKPNSTSHHVIWGAILTLREMGVEYFEMGEQVFSGDEKLVNIAKFKRGFGGKTVTRLNLTRE